MNISDLSVEQIQALQERDDAVRGYRVSSPVRAESVPTGACSSFTPRERDLHVCSVCWWSPSAHRADTSEPPVTRDGVTTQVVKRAAILTPDTSGLVLDSPGVLRAVETMRDRRAEWRAATGATRPTDRHDRTVYDDRCIDTEIRYDYARRDVEHAVRTANRGAAEAQIMAACRSL